MATFLDPTTMVGGGSSVTVNGSTFQVGYQGTPLKSVSSLAGTPGVSVSGGSVTITANGFTLDGYDLRGYEVNANANNVTVKNSLINATSYYAIEQGNGKTGLVVEYNTFDGGAFWNQTQSVMGRGGHLTVRNNEFLNIPQDAVSIQNGVVEHNYFAKVGTYAPAHADVIYIGGQTAPIRIFENYIDGTAYGANDTNNGLRILGEFAPVTHGVWVEGNVMKGGNYTIEASSRNYAASNITIVDNEIASGQYGRLYPSGSVAPTNFSYWHNTAFETGAVLANIGAQPVWQPTPPPPPPEPVYVLVNGTSGNDALTGGDGDEAINGLGGTDTIKAGGGNDRVTGGAGWDDLTGGTGADTFVYTANSDSAAGQGSRDLIRDFVSGSDKIDLSALDANTGTTTNEAFAFLGFGAFASTTTPGQVRYRHEMNAAGEARTVVEATTNATSGVDVQISLVGHLTLQASDFLL